MKKFYLLALTALCTCASAAAQAFTPTPVTPPAGLTTTTMTANVTSASWNYTFESEVEVGTMGNEMYIQGLVVDFPEAWIKGTVEGDDITFEQGQFIDYFGEEGYSYELYACGYTGNNSLCDFVLHRDAQTGIMTGTTGLGEFMEYEGYYYDLDRLTNIKIIPLDNGEAEETVAVPDNLDWLSYSLSAEDLRSGMVDYPALLAFDGDDVYLADFCDTAVMSGACIKGHRSDDETIVFPSEQFLQRYEDAYNIYMYGAAYDEETGTVTTGDFILDYNAETDTYHSRFTGILISIGKITTTEITFAEFMQDVVLFGEGAEADGIKATAASTAAPVIFSLDGRRTKSLQGITIKDGRVSINR